MAFCSKCGTKLEPDEKFCSNCGAPVEAEEKNSVVEAAKNVLDTEDTTGDYDPQDVQSSRGLAWLSYVGALVFIPMFVKKDSKYTQFHVRQGFTLFVIYVAYSILAFLLGLIKVNKYNAFWGITTRVTPWPITLLLWIGWVFLFVLSIIGIVNAAKGKAKKLPLIGNLDILSWFKKN